MGSSTTHLSRSFWVVTLVIGLAHGLFVWIDHATDQGVLLRDLDHKAQDAKLVLTIP